MTSFTQCLGYNTLNLTKSLSEYTYALGPASLGTSPLLGHPGLDLSWCFVEPEHRRALLGLFHVAAVAMEAALSPPPPYQLVRSPLSRSRTASTLGTQLSPFNARRLTFHAPPPPVPAGSLASVSRSHRFNPWYSTLTIQRSTFDIRCLTFDARCSTFNV